ncbi:SixA phosphatase family protein [Helicobacter winghamensis]|uniref:Phosphohistidine phosphatase n=1 Tax=Helicobacter winghamensis TaxID=157268 RepID=A0A2N3PIC1_9HELI|nr:phosphoglycerate mutase family protein [Helicobacter winghamensis]EEO25704.1 putative phosphohistidine phosphatase SixA [Helicobacter winghamensis ATCC BAA-430]PKT76049.1 phosphohistidine phosphatase [Helicobacter winghamensis]PKT76678.1 phosphohistidine phosphatase [Helicobacter winghamensis]PKT76797.1 phosphohistidine phosphatase [Helicobacter winghamensis]PKT80559.1 phosphohistidine phosphatase [Helicobacter winghamensis]
MRLILVRHAKAEDREKWIDKDDLKRPLTKKGVKQAKRIAKYIGKKYPNVDAVISSLALRACDTAKYITKKQAHCTFIPTPNINPEEGIEGFLRNKDKMEEDWQTLVVVGHEPSISEFVRFICAKGTLNLRVSKGCVVELERENEDNWVLVGLNNF